jgi:hypothetical protein
VAIQFSDLESGDPRVVGAVVQGKLTADDMVAFNRRISAVRAGGSRALVYLDLVGYEGQELIGVARQKLGHMSDLWSGIERLAYVVDREWILKLAGLIDAITPMHFRAYAADEAEEARRWVRGEAGETPET